MSQPSNKNKSRRRRGSSIGWFLQGRSILSLDFFKRNFVYIIFATGMMLMYISNKFVCQDYMAQTMKLHTELENAKTDCVNSSAKYNSMIRESQMKAFMAEMGLDLIAPEQPPYILNK